jgi:hypothetical protein
MVWASYKQSLGCFGVICLFSFTGLVGFVLAGAFAPSAPTATSAGLKGDDAHSSVAWARETPTLRENPRRGLGVHLLIQTSLAGYTLTPYFSLS